MTSTYITPELFTFLRELKDHNNREWFEANKPRYEAQVREPLLRFITGFGLRLAEISPHFVADVLNEAIFRHNREWPVAEVLARFRASHRQLLAALAGLSDEDLHRSYAVYDPAETDEDRERSVVWWLVANTYDHYQEHLPVIEAAQNV